MDDARTAAGFEFAPLADEFSQAINGTTGEDGDPVTWANSHSRTLDILSPDVAVISGVQIPPEEVESTAGPIGNTIRTYFETYTEAVSTLAQLRDEPIACQLPGLYALYDRLVLPEVEGLDRGDGSDMVAQLSLLNGELLSIVREVSTEIERVIVDDTSVLFEGTEADPAELAEEYVPLANVADHHDIRVDWRITPPEESHDWAQLKAFDGLVFEPLPLEFVELKDENEFLGGSVADLNWEDEAAFVRQIEQFVANLESVNRFTFAQEIPRTATPERAKSLSEVINRSRTEHH